MLSKKKKAPNPAQEPKSKQLTWEKGSTLEPGGAVLLSELWMEQRLQPAVVGSNVCTCSLPLLGQGLSYIGIKCKFTQEFGCTAGGFAWEILLPILLTKGNSAPKRLAHSLALRLFSAHKNEKPGLSSPGLTSRLLGHSFPSI